jgi:hypothetical protein
MSSLLTLDADHRAIGDSLVCLSVQRDTDRKAGRAIVPNDLNAADCLAAGPLSNGFQALFPESSVAHWERFKSRHRRQGPIVAQSAMLQSGAYTGLTASHKLATEVGNGWPARSSEGTLRWRRSTGT